MTYGVLGLAHHRNIFLEKYIFLFKNFMKPFYLWFYTAEDFRFGFPEKNEHSNRTESNQISNNTESCGIFQLGTLTQIDSKSASEESHVCIAIASLYISLSGLSWCYLKVTGPLWKKMLIEKNLSYGNILKIKISLVKLWFSKCYHRINFFLSIFFSTVVRSPLDNIMKDHSSLCRDLKWLYRPGILQMHFLNQSEALCSVRGTLFFFYIKNKSRFAILFYFSKVCSEWLLLFPVTFLEHSHFDTTTIQPIILVPDYNFFFQILEHFAYWLTQLPQINLKFFIGHLLVFFSFKVSVNGVASS